VVTHASDYGVGASLEQADSTGQRRPVCFFSHSLNAAEHRYPVNERKLFGLVVALRTWRHCLLEFDFSVVCQTDHRPLQHFLTHSNLSARQVRWQIFLTDNNLEVQFLPGCENFLADGLRRRSDLRSMALAAVSPYDGWPARITKVCKCDPEAGELRKLALNKHPKNRGQYVLRHGVHMWSARGLLRVYVSISLRVSLIKQFHDTAIPGHFGTRQTYPAIAQNYYWPRMIETVKSYVARCATYVQRVKATQPPTPPIQPHDISAGILPCIPHHRRPTFRPHARLHSTAAAGTIHMAEEVVRRRTSEELRS
jgi:hypothetical protein